MAASKSGDEGTKRYSIQTFELHGGNIKKATIRSESLSTSTSFEMAPDDVPSAKLGSLNYVSGDASFRFSHNLAAIFFLLHQQTLRIVKKSVGTPIPSAIASAFGESFLS